MKDDPLLNMAGTISRDFQELGIPERLALPLAEFAAASVMSSYAGTQLYVRKSCMLGVRNQALREAVRSSTSSVGELVELTGLSKKRIYAILNRRNK